MNTLQSHLLVAVPNLPDSNFFRSVVLLIHHDEEGAFGVILNRPSTVQLKDVWKQIAEEPCESTQPIHVGGPVEGPLIALHTVESLAENAVIPGVFVATQKDMLDQIVGQDTEPYRIYSGYAGWGKGQLEAELSAGGWLSTPATADFIFGNHADLWRTVADAIGKKVVLSDINDNSLPNDPGLN